MADKEFERDEQGRFASGGFRMVEAHARRWSDFGEWLDTLRSGTREKHGYHLIKFLEGVNLTPTELKGMPVKDVRSLYLKYRKGVKQYAQRGVYYALMSFFDYMEVDFKLRRIDRVIVEPKRVLKEYIPSPIEIYQLANASASASLKPRSGRTKKFKRIVALKNKALILCAFQSGVRRKCLNRWNWGLVEGDIYPTLRIPVRLKITYLHDTKMLGYGVKYYYTFLGKESAFALKEYLDELFSMGWKPENEDTRIWLSFSSGHEKFKPMGDSNFYLLCKRYAPYVGIKPDTFYPHCLRKAFRKVLRNAPIDEETKEALMGHKLSGSRANYWDYHDVDEIEAKYMVADFSANRGTQALNGLRRDMKESEEEIERLKEEVRKLRREREEANGNLLKKLELALQTPEGQKLLEKLR